MNARTVSDSLVKLLYASILAGLILAFVNPARLSHPGAAASSADGAASR